jgi:hypothetical protein
MSQRTEQHAAKMRCANTETQRRKLWRELHRKQDAGELTGREVAQFKQEFWDTRREDKKIAS